MRRLAWTLAALCGTAGTPSAALAQATTQSAAASAPAELLVVRATLNTVNKGELFIARASNDFLIRSADLDALGLRLASGGSETVLQGERYLSLRSLGGIDFTFDPATVTLNITAHPSLLPLQSIAASSSQRALGAIPQQRSVFLNYALTGSGGSDNSAGGPVGLTGELGWRVGDFLLLSDASTVQDAEGRRRFVRLQTSLTHDDREQLRRTVVGDFFTPAREFGTGVNVGGLSISKRYGLNPYFVQSPLQNLSGNVALPSELEVYVDGQRIRSEKLNPGAFELRDIVASAGARSVQLLIRDALGREERIDYALYFSDQPLARGLHEYSYNLGALRRDYGEKSSSYGPLAYAMFHRYGISDALTLGVRAEGSQGLINAGPLATLVLGPAGVLGAAVAGSSVAGLTGTAATVNYAYQGGDWSLGASLRRDSADYAELGDPSIVSNRKFEASVTGSYRLARGAVSISHASLLTRAPRLDAAALEGEGLRVQTLDKRRVTSLSYNLPLASWRASLSASLSHTKTQGWLTGTASSNEFFVLLNLFFDSAHGATASLRTQQGQQAQSLQLTRYQPIGEGLGYTLQADRTTGHGSRTAQARASLQYNAPAAIVRGDLTRREGGGTSSTDYQATVAGALAYVDGSFALGRPVNQGFGIVSVGSHASGQGLAGVEVEINGQPMGKTNARGQVFAPALGTYVDNTVVLSTTSLPIDYAVATLSQKVSPSHRGGALIRFDAKRLQAFTGVLKVARAGALTPLELVEVTLNAPGASTFLTGRRGEFYLENVAPGRYAARTQADGRACTFELVIPTSGETFVALGESVCTPEP